MTAHKFEQCWRKGGMEGGERGGSYLWVYYTRDDDDGGECVSESPCPCKGGTEWSSCIRASGCTRLTFNEVFVIAWTFSRWNKVIWCWLNACCRAIFAGCGSSHCSGGFHDSGRHFWWHGGCLCCSQDWRDFSHQPDTSIDFNIGVVLSCHVQYFQTIIIEPRELALEETSFVFSTDGYLRLGVEDG